MHQYVDLFLHESHMTFVLVNIFQVLSAFTNLSKPNVSLSNWTTRKFIILVFLFVPYDEVEPSYVIH